MGKEHSEELQRQEGGEKRKEVERLPFLVLVTVNPRALPVSVSMKKRGISCECVHEK